MRLASAREPGMSPINALSVALYIEESIIEQRFFEVFAADAPELKRVLADLAACHQRVTWRKCGKSGASRGRQRLVDPARKTPCATLILDCHHQIALI